MAKDMSEGLEANSIEIHQRMNRIIETANQLPGNTGKEFTKSMREMFKTMVDSLSESERNCHS